MTELGSIMHRIKAHQQRVALDSTLQPSGTTGYDYGLLVGRVKGMQEVLEIIEAMVVELNEGED